MKEFIKIAVFVSVFCKTFSAPQTAEIVNQFEESHHAEAEAIKADDDKKQPADTTIDDIKTNDTLPVDRRNDQINDEISFDDIAPNTFNITTNVTQDLVTKETLISKFYSAFSIPLERLLRVPKVNFVIKNVGTCIVNGAMELITYYFPAPLIPLIASAAGLIIPFEPVVLLKQKMPVNSYRRAIKLAVNSFMGTFNNYRQEGEDDPYMTGRFYRRFMGNSKENKDVKT